MEEDEELDIGNPPSAAEHMCVNPLPSSVKSTCFYNQDGNICTILGKQYILTNLGSSPVIIAIGIDTTINESQFGCLFLWKNLKPILLKDVEEGTAVKFDAVVIPPSKKFTPLVVWQGEKPSITIEPQYGSFVFVHKILNINASVVSLTREYGNLSFFHEGRKKNVTFNPAVLYINGGKLIWSESSSEFFLNNPNVNVDIAVVAEAKPPNEGRYIYVCMLAWKGIKPEINGLLNYLDTPQLCKIENNVIIGHGMDIVLHLDKKASLKKTSEGYRITFNTKSVELEMNIKHDVLYCGCKAASPIQGEVNMHALCRNMSKYEIVFIQTNIDYRCTSKNIEVTVPDINGKMSLSSEEQCYTIGCFESLVSNDDKTSEIIVSDAEMPGENIVNNLDNISERMVSNAKRTSEKMMINANKTKERIVSNSDKTSERMMNNVDNTSEKRVNNADKTSVSLMSNSDKTSESWSNIGKISKRMVSNADNISEKIVNNADKTNKKMESSIEMNNDRMESSVEMNNARMESSVELNNDRMESSVEMNNDRMESSVKMNNDMMESSIEMNNDRMESSVEMNHDRKESSVEMNNDRMESSVEMNNEGIVNNTEKNIKKMSRSKKSSKRVTNFSEKSSEILENIADNTMKKDIGDSSDTQCYPWVLKNHPGILCWDQSRNTFIIKASVPQEVEILVGPRFKLFVFNELLNAVKEITPHPLNFDAYTRDNHSCRYNVLVAWCGDLPPIYDGVKNLYFYNVLGKVAHIEENCVYIHSFSPVIKDKYLCFPLPRILYSPYNLTQSTLISKSVLFHLKQSTDVLDKKLEAFLMIYVDFNEPMSSFIPVSLLQCDSMNVNVQEPIDANTNNGLNEIDKEPSVEESTKQVKTKRKKKKKQSSHNVHDSSMDVNIEEAVLGFTNESMVDKDTLDASVNKFPMKTTGIKKKIPSSHTSYDVHDLRNKAYTKIMDLPKYLKTFKGILTENNGKIIIKCWLLEDSFIVNIPESISIMYHDHFVLAEDIPLGTHIYFDAYKYHKDRYMVVIAWDKCIPKSIEYNSDVSYQYYVNAKFVGFQSNSTCRYLIKHEGKMEIVDCPKTGHVLLPNGRVGSLPQPGSKVQLHLKKKMVDKDCSFTTLFVFLDHRQNHLVNEKKQVNIDGKVKSDLSNEQARFSLKNEDNFKENKELNIYFDTKLGKVECVDNGFITVNIVHKDMFHKLIIPNHLIFNISQDTLPHQIPLSAPLFVTVNVDNTNGTSFNPICGWINPMQPNAYAIYRCNVYIVDCADSLILLKADDTQILCLCKKFIVFRRRSNVSLEQVNESLIHAIVKDIPVRLIKGNQVKKEILFLTSNQSLCQAVIEIMNNIGADNMTEKREEPKESVSLSGIMCIEQNGLASCVEQGKQNSSNNLVKKDVLQNLSNKQEITKISTKLPNRNSVNDHAIKGMKLREKIENYKASKIFKNYQLIKGKLIQEGEGYYFNYQETGCDNETSIPATLVRPQEKNLRKETEATALFYCKSNEDKFDDGSALIVWCGGGKPNVYLETNKELGNLDYTELGIVGIVCNDGMICDMYLTKEEWVYTQRNKKASVKEMLTPALQHKNKNLYLVVEDVQEQNVMDMNISKKVLFMSCELKLALTVCDMFLMGTNSGNIENELSYQEASDTTSIKPQCPNDAFANAGTKPEYELHLVYRNIVINGKLGSPMVLRHFSILVVDGGFAVLGDSIGKAMLDRKDLYCGEKSAESMGSLSQILHVGECISAFVTEMEKLIYTSQYKIQHIAVVAYQGCEPPSQTPTLLSQWKINPSKTISLPGRDKCNQYKTVNSSQQASSTAATSHSKMNTEIDKSKSKLQSIIKHNTKGKCKTVTEKGVIVRVESGGGLMQDWRGCHRLFRRNNCYLYGISLAGHDLTQVLLGESIEVDYEEHGDEGVRVLVGGGALEPAQQYQMLESWCRSKGVSLHIMDDLLCEVGWLPEELNPLLDVLDHADTVDITNTDVWQPTTHS